MIGFVAGLCSMALLVFLRRAGITLRHGSFDIAIVIGTVVLTFLSLRPILRTAKKEAVPAREGDWIGYAVILIFLVAVASIGFFALR